MCELFGFSGKNERNLIPYLLEFYSHGGDNPHGWGLAVRDRSEGFRIEKEAVRSDHSRLLPPVMGTFRVFIRLCACSAVSLIAYAAGCFALRVKTIRTFAADVLRRR